MHLIHEYVINQSLIVIYFQEIPYYLFTLFIIAAIKVATITIITIKLIITIVPIETKAVIQYKTSLNYLEEFQDQTSKIIITFKE